MTIHDEYLYYQKKYEKKYGKEKTIVLMAVGSFHEAYATNDQGYNLSEISELLNIVLTKKNKKIEEVSVENPYMLGFPSVALNKYLRVLVNNGFTVVVIDQVTPPPNPKREITGIYSPGTYIEEAFSPDSNNIVGLFIEDEYQTNGEILMCIGMSVVDLSTGECCIHESYSINGDEKYALDEAVRFISNYNPKEILIYRKELDSKYTSKNNKIIKGMDKKNLILYLELDTKKFYYHDKIDKNFYKISYINEFLKKTYPNTGMLSPLEYLDMERKAYATMSFMGLLNFCYQHNENIINNLYKPSIYEDKKHLILGNNAIFQLNVFENSSLDGFNKQFKSLFDVTNNTSTAMGRRFLKTALNNPIVSIKELNNRYNCIEELMNESLYSKVEDHLRNILDIERLVRKLSLYTLNPFELLNLKNSFDNCINVIKIVEKTKMLKKILPEDKVIKNIKEFLDNFDIIFCEDEIKKYSLNDMRENVFNTGIYPDIDVVQKKITGGIKFMENIQIALSKYITDDKKPTKFTKHTKNTKNTKNIKKNIKKNTQKNTNSDNLNNNLEEILETEEDEILPVKLLRNDRDGYYLKLTKIRADSLRNNTKDLDKIKIIDDLELETEKLKYKDLKDTTKIFIDELSKKSDDVVIWTEKIMGMLKNKIIECYENYYTKYKGTFKKISEFIATIDFLKSAAKTAKLYNYTKPEILTNNGKVLDNGCIDCEQLRHPIIERIKTDCEYIPHNFKLGKDNNFKEGDDVLDGMLIFGINSSGKSVCMKAIGLSVIMAQTGMFVPAKQYKFSPYTTLFARITGNDNIFKGLSSFALEMTELRAILKRTGPKTLVIGDEVCRGTEHISGTSIVAATIINLSKTGSTFIFATHLHEIPHMERIKNLKNVKSFHLTVKHDEQNDTLIFDRKLKPGPGLPIYGVLVAKHIIQDREFIGLAQEIKNEILQTPNDLISTKTSKYNSSMYMTNCGVCGKVFKNVTDRVGFFDTHHINHQKDCKDGFVINKPHLKMNVQANLVALCKKCHFKAHHNEININGYIETSNGRILDYDICENNLIDISDDQLNDDDNNNNNDLNCDNVNHENINNDNIDNDNDNDKDNDKDNDNDNDNDKDEDKNEDIISVPPIKNTRRKKYSDDDIKKVLKLKDNKVSKTKAKQTMMEKYNINMSSRIINQIWNNTY